MQNLHITILLKFSFLKNIGNVTSNNGLIFLKKFSHLGLCQPDSVIFQTYINLGLSVLALIYDYLILFHID